MIRICLRHGVELQRHAALLARGVVLVQDPLHGSLVNGDDGGTIKFAPNPNYEGQYKPTADAMEWNILLDGTDCASLSREEVRSQFAMVLQDTWLFRGTIAENVSYGTPGATREQIVEACDRAYCDHFIRTLPQGYDTVVGDDMTNLSGGQKQLLTIARAMLANRRLLILDEATSNVDTRTEILLQKAMDRLMKGRTCFVIAHRLSTIVDSDLILVLDHGHIVEQGTHTELLARRGFYYQLYTSQYAI